MLYDIPIAASVSRLFAPVRLFKARFFGIVARFVSFTLFRAGRTTPLDTSIDTT